MLGKLLAGILGLMAFSVCLVGGIIAGARAQVVILRGLQAMVLFALLGAVIGWAAETVVRDRVRKEALQALEEARKRQAPPGSGDGTPTTGAGADG